MLLTLSIAVYNKPEYLWWILLTCARQTMREVEIFVADDGSGPEIARVVERGIDELRLNLRHLWQEDMGWRKNRMLNEVIRAASTGYLVFIDGDCLLHHRFLEDHWKGRESRVVLCGRRVELGQGWLDRLEEKSIRNGSFERLGPREWSESLREGGRAEEGIRIDSPRISRALHRGGTRLLGSNFSIHREDILAVNGFDERYAGPGWGEDADLQLRLERAGIRPVALRHRGIQYHLHHGRTEPDPRSEKLFRELEREERSWTPHGIDAGRVDEGA